MIKSFKNINVNSVKKSRPSQSKYKNKNDWSESKSNDMEPKQVNRKQQYKDKESNPIHPKDKQANAHITVKPIAAICEYPQYNRVATHKGSTNKSTFTDAKYAKGIDVNIKEIAHKHPNCHGARHYLENKLFKSLDIRVLAEGEQPQYYEIACSSRSTYFALPNIHYSRPVLNCHDKNNRIKVRDNLGIRYPGIGPINPDAGYTYCECKIETCEHLKPEQTLISTDVLYYTHSSVVKHMLEQYMDEGVATSTHIIHIPYQTGNLFESEGRVELIEDSHDFSYETGSEDAKIMVAYTLPHKMKMEIEGNNMVYEHDALFCDLPRFSCDYIDVTITKGNVSKHLYIVANTFEYIDTGATHYTMVELTVEIEKPVKKMKTFNCPPIIKNVIVQEITFEQQIEAKMEKANNDIAVIDEPRLVRMMKSTDVTVHESDVTTDLESGVYKMEVDKVVRQFRVINLSSYRCFAGESTNMVVISKAKYDAFFKKVIKQVITLAMDTKNDFWGGIELDGYSQLQLLVGADPDILPYYPLIYSAALKSVKETMQTTRKVGVNKQLTETVVEIQKTAKPKKWYMTTLEIIALILLIILSIIYPDYFLPYLISVISIILKEKFMEYIKPWFIRRVCSANYYEIVQRLLGGAFFLGTIYYYSAYPSRAFLDSFSPTRIVKELFSTPVATATTQVVHETYESMGILGYYTLYHVLKIIKNGIVTGYRYRVEKKSYESKEVGQSKSISSWVRAAVKRFEGCDFWRKSYVAKGYLIASKIVFTDCKKTTQQQINNESNTDVIAIFIALFLIYTFIVLYRQLYCGKTQKEQPEIVEGSCASYRDNYVNQCPYPKDPRIKWKLPIKYDATISEWEQFKCYCESNSKKMTKLSKGSITQPIIYNSCAKCNICSMKRLAADWTLPDPVVFSKFKAWVEKVYEREVYPIIDKYFQKEYSVEKWYNHLGAKKQAKLAQFVPGSIRYDPSALPQTIDTTYENFVKSEKQIKDEDENGNVTWPKTRAICAPSEALKYVMGVAVYALQNIMKEHLFGFVMPSNMEEMEEELTEELESVKVNVSGDLSGCDNTLDVQFKEVLHFPIYKYVEKYLTHCTRLQWQCVYAKDRKVKMVVNIGGKMVNMGYMIVPGKTFSGSPDTYFGNTLFTGFIVRYVNEEILGLRPNIDYKLAVKGDDFFARYLVYITNKNLEKAYYTVFNKKNKPGEKIGLGVIAKYLNIGDVETVEFLSLDFFINDDKVKVVRQLKKILSNDVWSRKAANQPEKAYMIAKAMKIGAQSWAPGSNIIIDVYDAILDGVTKSHWQPSKSKSVKEVLDVDDEDYRYESIETPYLDYCDDNEYWAEEKFKERKSSQPINSSAYLEFLYKRYGYTENYIRDAIETIRSG